MRPLSANSVLCGVIEDSFLVNQTFAWPFFRVKNVIFPVDTGHTHQDRNRPSSVFLMVIRILLRLPFTRRLVMAQRAHFPRGRWETGRRARTGEDAQRVPCARAMLQVGRGGCNEPSMYCDTNLGKIVTARILTVTSSAFCPSPSCPHAPCLVHACANVLFAHVCHTSCV